MAHVAAWKKDIVDELVKEMTCKPVVAVVDMEGIAGQQSRCIVDHIVPHPVSAVADDHIIFFFVVLPVDF